MKIDIKKLAVTAIMLAAATLLSVFELMHLPQGGSITLASALPVMIVAVRYGTPWGLLAGLVFGLIQLVIGANTLSYVTGPAAIAAVIILDYLLAFACYGLAGTVRKLKPQPVAFVLGAFIVCVTRYICHVISGCTVWAGLSIPTDAAFQYSLIYNATYMLPEMLVLIVVAYYVSSTLDFTGKELRPLRTKDSGTVPRMLLDVAGVLVAAGAVFDIVQIFAHMQGEDGTFSSTALTEIPWPLIIIVTAIVLAAAAVLLIISQRIAKQQKEAKA